MAGTFFDPNTLDEWILLHDVRAIVAQFCPEQSAGELILEYIHKRSQSRPLAYDCLWPEGASGGCGINPLIWGTLAPAFGFYCPVDFDNSTVTAMRFPPEMEHGSEVAVALKGLRKYSRDGKLFPSIGYPYQLRLVRLHRDDVIAMLRAFGFLLPEPGSTATAQDDESGAAQAPELRGATEQWVYNRMKSDPPEKVGKDNYAGTIFPDRPDKSVRLKRIQNLVADIRRELRLPSPRKPH